MTSIRTGTNFPIFLFNCLLFLLPLLYVYGIRDPSSMPRYFLISICACIGLIYWAWSLRQGLVKIVWHYSFGLIGAFALFAVISTTWSNDPHNSLIEILQLISLCILAFLAGQYLTGSILLKTVKIAVIGATIVSVIGILQYYYFNPFKFMDLATPSATFTNRNFAGLYLDLVLPVALVLVLVENSKPRRWLYGLAYALCLGYIFCIQTRGTWLGLIIALITGTSILAFNKPIRQLLVLRFKPAAIVLVVSTVIAFTIPFLQGKIQEHITPEEKTGSTGIRANAYHNALYLLKDNAIFGTGYGNFRLAFRPYAFSAQGHELTQVSEDLSLERLHNDILQMYIELGIAGGMLFSVIAFLALRFACHGLSKESDATSKLILLGLMLALIASLIHAVVDFPLRKPSSAAMFWIWVGCIFGWHARLSTQKTYQVSPEFPKYIIGLTSLILIFNVYFYSTYFAGSRHLLIAENAMSNKDCAGAMLAIDKSMSAFGFDFQTKMNQIIIYSYCSAPLGNKLMVMNNALSYDPGNARALLTRGYLLLLIKDYEGSRRDFLKITQLLPHRASGYAGLAKLALSRQDYATAEKYAQEAISKEPDNEEYKKLLQQIGKQ